jgi:hypothetical protein
VSYERFCGRKQILPLCGPSIREGVPASNDTINFSNGTINFTGPVTINGQFNWSGGTLSGSPLTIASNAVLNISGSGSRMVANVLTNAGTVNWAPSGGTFYVQNNNANLGGAIYNVAEGLWDLQTDQYLRCYYCGASELFNNAGTVRKSGGTGTTYHGVGFCNSSVVSVLAGTLSLGGGGTVEGTFNASAGTAIHWSGGAFSHSAVAVLNGPGTIQMTGGSLTRW